MDETFVIKGGRRLTGDLPVRGSKNAALKALAASLLFHGPVSISNIPFIEDVKRMIELIQDLGANVTSNRKKITIENSGIYSSRLNDEISKRFRASIVLSAPILVRTGKVSFPHPGGCLIGKRPIDIFLEGFSAMGAQIHTASTWYTLSAKRLRGIDFSFRTPSVSATETLMMAAIHAHGTTILRNAAQEPEVAWLAEFLKDAGAHIEGVGTHTLVIKGNPKLRLKQKRTMSMMPDRIEAGTFAMLAASTKSNLKITQCIPEHITAVTSLLKRAGFIVKERASYITVSPPPRLDSRLNPIESERAARQVKKRAVSVDAKTGVYPNFATDMQAPFAVLLTQTKGDGEIFETIFSNRFQYVKDLRKMGANIVRKNQHHIIISGPTPLHGSELRSPDLRAGLAYIIAALVAKGSSVIHNVYQIDRGYEQIEKRLQKLGANIKRV